MNGVWLRRPENGTAVVFVHGVLSSGETGWKNSNGTYWPALLAAETALTQHGIYVFTYKTNLFSGTYRLGDAVDALKEHMRLDGLFDCRRWVFIAHSMGGLVVRKLLVERVIDLREHHISVGMFLVASPSLGSRYADILEPLARLFGHTQADALRFAENNAWLRDLDREFFNLKEASSIALVGKELVEDVFVVFDRLIRAQIVPSFSGHRYFGEPYKVPESDHFSIAKPASAAAIQHRLLVRFIAEMPEPEVQELPLEPELRGRLEQHLRACTQARLPFRTYHRLAALFAMRSQFARNCFNTAGKDTAAKIDAWLRETILDQGSRECGLGAPGVLEDDEAVTKAMSIANQERATEIDERHLLLAVLQDRTKGTLREICQRLGERTVDSIYCTAQFGRPRRAHPGASAVPFLKL